MERGRAPASELLLTTVFDARLVDNVDISKLSDVELCDRAVKLAALQRECVWELVETLVAMDERRSSTKTHGMTLFQFCICKLRLSEAAAYRRIRAARAIELFPPISPLLRDGELTLEGIALLHPHLEGADATALVSQARGKRTQEIECLIAQMTQSPPPRRDVIRYVPKPPMPPQLRDSETLALTIKESPSSPDRGPTVPETPPPINAPSVRIAFTADAAFHERLRLTQAAMRHKYPDGRLEGIFFDALDALLRRVRPWAYKKARRGKACAAG